MSKSIHLLSLSLVRSLPCTISQNITSTLGEGRDIPALRTGREGLPSSGSLQGNLHSLLPLISSSWGFTGDPGGSLGKAAIPYLLTSLYSSSH
ncbi:unnamed protein product [Cuscuta campestris]|uniref:Secreted protein n=1 Tax=Cuscuta campestris TaxID=132261 RepID=A0A484KXJ0_9ASTE|nr:unnamed protein product [Cuscuta campestris]